MIAYRTKKYIYTLLGPFAGYVSGSNAFDIYAPWEMLLVALVAPLVAYAVYEWAQRREIDEHKLIPLFLGVGSYGILVSGVLNWGNPTGGYFGITEGDYAFQNAEVNLLWQAIGLAVCLGVGLVTGWVLVAVLRRTTGLAVSEEVQVAGYDASYWEIVHDAPAVQVSAAAPPETAAVGAGAGDGVEAGGDGADAGEIGARPPG
jgi:ammonium transporter, Amt family